jgi:AcrR family transcriptional regulator
VPGKRRAILDAARAVFAREGYPRASIEAIAAAADVSTRTVYNHFRDKADLFHAVVTDSATAFADAQLAILERHRSTPPSGVDDVRTRLVAFAREWTAPLPGHAEHLALVRRMEAEAGHVPPAVITSWRDAGPRRVRAALADWLSELARRGLLHVDDPDRAATHFARLVAEDRFGTAPDDAHDVVDSGVHAFLHGYGHRPTRV